MIESGASNEELELFANNAITSYQIQRLGLTGAQKESMEDLSQYEGLNEEEEIYIKKFYSEYYANRTNIPEDFRLLNTKDLLAESSRINNNRNNDVYEVARKRGLLSYLGDDTNMIEKRLSTEMDDDDLNWEKVYSFLGYEDALNYIIESSLRELVNGGLDSRLTMIRFHVKMERLRIADKRRTDESTRGSKAK